MAAGTWEDELDDWEHELDRPDGNPVIALLLGCVVIIVVAVIAFPLIPIDVSRHIPGTLLAAILLAAAIWGAAWLLTVRYAPPIWAIITGGAYGIIAMFCAAMAIGFALIAVRTDIATMQRIAIDQTGKPAIPRGSSPGPITRRALHFYSDYLEQDHLRARVYLKLSMDKVGQTWAVVGQPSLLDDCGRFPRAQPELDAIDARAVAVVRRFRADLPALIADPKLLKPVLAQLDTGFPIGGARKQAQVALVHEQLTLAAKLCGVLARKHWRPQGSMFGFTSPADLNEYRTLSERWYAVLRELRPGAIAPPL